MESAGLRDVDNGPPSSLPRPDVVCVGNEKLDCAPVLVVLCGVSSTSSSCSSSEVLLNSDRESSFDFLAASSFRRRCEVALPGDAPEGAFLIRRVLVTIGLAVLCEKRKVASVMVSVSP